MSRISTVMIILVSCWMSVTTLLAASSDIENARQHGAQGQVTFHVIDSTGKPVEEAEMRAVFFLSDSPGGAVVSKGLTDTNGMFIAAGRTIHSVTYFIKKDGYYSTEGQYWFHRRGEDCVKDGRWQPWSPTNTVMLKERRHPIPMYAKRVETRIPAVDRPVGFDLEVGDWVTPHGNGRHSDLLFSYITKIQDYWTFSNRLNIACSHRASGLLRLKQDMESSFRSIYEAPIDGYQEKITLLLNRTKFIIVAKEEIGSSEYLIFRVRTVEDDNGDITSARYGKIYGPIEYGERDQGGGGVRFTYYLNPAENDRNLEFDPSRNLFPDTPFDRVTIP